MALELLMDVILLRLLLLLRRDVERADAGRQPDRGIMRVFTQLPVPRLGSPEQFRKLCAKFPDIFLHAGHVVSVGGGALEETTDRFPIVGFASLLSDGRHLHVHGRKLLPCIWIGAESRMLVLEHLQGIGQLSVGVASSQL
ncbi:hypothetical protein [Bradyrhizobium cenepequi]|uniref:hypothetical protein n=1 Tax=Bradyrhizobium cenepequi TaxID=2821403 RepID=UPI001CE257C8|nr:hypothetical protein [Bradyrhizobium cenepequi]MCA6112482.1 hypothetical protein [Bradyrhizobium cenepequi]